MTHLDRLFTEMRNEKTMNLDSLRPIEIVKLINEEDKKVALSVEKELGNIALAIEEIVKRRKKGGRLIYIGAGTSGRLGIIDSVECPPTFSASYDEVIGIIAGGKSAFVQAGEGAEDCEDAAVKDLKQIDLKAEDSVIGITASGRTPYVLAALAYANEIGALTIALTANSNSIAGCEANIRIETETGPEVLTGSTRMKAATAHKMVLNMISTGTMIQLGKVYENLMVDVHVSNEKLRHRAIGIIQTITGLSKEKAQQIFEQANGEVKAAIVMHKKQVSYEEASKYLEKYSGHIRKALEEGAE
ncbi:N-acetylmuramic acid 6-phosphate etherase [Paenibacillus dendritiformis]|uniref:N-acetylmuramic acid 6-phosphate etherase n=1 Tax=Paenibacillus dendritiformis C454 TaxID=1131935 RepID=H3SEE2_9BACL|nr:N-acetylmuramic acid-6-phosphate etherase [Paenibacillus dendritiformis C454]